MILRQAVRESISFAHVECDGGSLSGNGAFLLEIPHERPIFKKQYNLKSNSQCLAHHP